MKEYNLDEVLMPGSYEYFCTKCGQLRLALVTEFRGCRNCGNDQDIIFGLVGDLDIRSLRENWEKQNGDSRQNIS